MFKLKIRNNVTEFLMLCQRQRWTIFKSWKLWIWYFFIFK